MNPTLSFPHFFSIWSKKADIGAQVQLLSWVNQSSLSNTILPDCTTRASPKAFINRSPNCSLFAEKRKASRQQQKRIDTSKIAKNIAPNNAQAKLPITYNVDKKIRLQLRLSLLVSEKQTKYCPEITRSALHSGAGYAPSMFTRCCRPSACVIISITFFICALLAVTSCSLMVSSPPRYYLAYGIEEYPGIPLHYSVDDAKKMAGLLDKSGYTKLALRLDSDATEDNIKADFEKLTNIEKDALIVIYYSGHGTKISAAESPTREDIPCLVPFDSVVEYQGTNPVQIYIATERLISPQMLSTWLDKSNSPNVVLILDTCFSGGFVNANGTLDLTADEMSDYAANINSFGDGLNAFSDLLESNANSTRAPIVLSASGSRSYAYETDSLKNGVFTYYLAEAAYFADGNNDGYITVSECYNYVLRSVNSKYGAHLYPHISGGARDFVLFAAQK